jgi:hypothetical protein
MRPARWRYQANKLVSCGPGWRSDLNVPDKYASLPALVSWSTLTTCSNAWGCHSEEREDISMWNCSSTPSSEARAEIHCSTMTYAYSTPQRGTSQTLCLGCAEPRYKYDCLSSFSAVVFRGCYGKSGSPFFALLCEISNSAQL